MGKSKNIDDLAKINREFDQYIADRTAEMDAYTAAMQEEIDKMIDEHYKGFDDAVHLLGNKNQHLTTMDEWSLTSVNRMIETCCNAIFGVAKPPEGSTKDVEADSTKTSNALAAIKEQHLLIATAAMSAIQGVLLNFTNSTSTQIEKEFSTKPIGPGIVLFIGITNNSYKRKDFFTNTTIVQNMYVFKTYYSFKDGEAQAKLSLLDFYTEKLMTYKQIGLKFLKQIEELDIGSEDYIEKFERLQKNADMVDNNVTKAYAEIAKLAGVNLLADNSSIRELYDGLHNGLREARMQQLDFKANQCLASKK